jgi:hypothetical protein
MPEVDHELLNMRGYSYRIWGYGLGHSELIIRATHEDKQHHNAHLCFSDVQYFQFPLGWKGDLVPASDEELLEIMKRAGVRGWDKVLPRSEVRRMFHLYKAETDKSTVYILGHLYRIEYDVEPIYN